MLKDNGAAAPGPAPVMLKDRVAIFKDAFAGIREAMLVVLLLVLIIDPGIVARWLNASPFGKVGVFGLTLEQKEKAAQTSVATGQSIAQLTNRASAAEEQVAKLTETIQQLKQTASPAAAPELARLEVQARTAYQSIGQTLTAADTAARSNAQSIAVQSKVLQSEGSKAVAQTGWVMAGRVDATKTLWAGQRPYVTAASPAALADGTTSFTVAASLRSLSDPADGSGQFARRDVVGALAEGERVKILDKGYFPARGGGYFLWLKVQRG